MTANFRTEYARGLTERHETYQTPGIVAMVDESGTLLEIVTPADSIAEARELAADHYSRLNPDDDPCPYCYEFHARSGSGRFSRVASFII